VFRCADTVLPSACVDADDQYQTFTPGMTEDNYQTMATDDGYQTREQLASENYNSLLEASGEVIYNTLPEDE
jgi:hypothetical protein